MSINICALTGNLTRDAEIRRTASGTSILSFSIAVNDRRKNNISGQWENVPNFIDCVLFGARAESLQAYLKTGVKVGITGKLRWSSWERNGEKRSKIDVVVDDVELLTHPQNQVSDDCGKLCGKPVDNSPGEFSTMSEPSIYDQDLPF